MYQFLEKLPFLLEIIFNGLFIAIVSILKLDQDLNLWPSRSLLEGIVEFQKEIIPLIFFFNTTVNYLRSKSSDYFMRRSIFGLLIFLASVVVWGDIDFTYWFAIAHLPNSLSIILKNDRSRSRVESNKFGLQFAPAQVVVFTFLIPIFLGTTILLLPISSSKTETLPFIDALFITTSATCVTALSPISIGSDLSSFGQLIIMGLMQIGGLGIMILYASMTLLLGRSLAMKERIVIQDVMDINGPEELINTIFDILKYTFVIEFWGTIILTIGFVFEGLDFGQAFYYGIFHSISAFCNSGLALFDNSFEDFAVNPSIHFTLAVLITLGGLGFSVLKKLKEAFIDKKGIKVLDIHSKIILVTSFILTVSGAILIFFGEYMNGLDKYDLWQKIQIAIFQSVTLRTAGFNTVPITTFHSYTLFMMTLYMFVGASSGSTGGGIKTSTFAVLIQSVRATLSGKDRVEFFKRSIPNLTIVKSTAITIISLIVTTLGVFLMMKAMPNHGLLELHFEVMSAFSTVGLSLGITSQLSFAGKLIIIILMFIGRVGPLTLVLAIGQKTSASGNFQYPDGRIVVG